MAEVPNNPLNQALTGLDTTIQSITGKVAASKTRVREYKVQIITKLREVVGQLNSLKDNNNLKALPQLRKQLQDSQVALQQKTEELDQTKGQLNEANQNLQELQQNMEQINRQLEEKNQQIAELTNSGTENGNEIQELNAQIVELDRQKKELERQVASVQEQSNSLIERFGIINATLGQQITLIDSIVDELGDLDNENDDVSIQFKAVGDNIMAIMNMINNPGQGGAEQGAQQVNQQANQQANQQVNQQANQQANQQMNQQVNQQMNQQVEDLYQRFINSEQTKKDSFYRNLNGTPNQSSINIIQNNIKRAVERDDEQSIKSIKDELQKIINSGNVPLLGGKTRRHKRHGKRKTMKKKHRKTRKPIKKKYKGGYVYSSSRDLDKASSVISASSSSKSTSNKRNKTRRHSS
jgi:chromosome segregation ATPase